MLHRHNCNIRATAIALAAAVAFLLSSGADAQVWNEVEYGPSGELVRAAGFDASGRAVHVAWASEGADGASSVTTLFQRGGQTLVIAARAGSGGVFVEARGGGTEFSAGFETGGEGQAPPVVYTLPDGEVVIVDLGRAASALRGTARVAGALAGDVTVADLARGYLRARASLPGPPPWDGNEILEPVLLAGERGGEDGGRIPIGHLVKCYNDCTNGCPKQCGWMCGLNSRSPACDVCIVSCAGGCAIGCKCVACDAVRPGLD